MQFTLSKQLPTRASLARATSRARMTCTAVKIGDSLPDVTVQEGSANFGEVAKIPIRSLFAGKRGILFAVPGAFTPTCSKSHLPSYIAQSAALKAAGLDVIACLATNDAWTMQAWGEQQGATGKVRMLSDVSGDLSMALGTSKPPGGMMTRSKRFSMIIVDNKVAAFHDADVEGNNECTFADAILADLPKVLAKAGVDPLEAFCETDPSADECRVYSD